MRFRSDFGRCRPALKATAPPDDAAAAGPGGYYHTPGPGWCGHRILSEPGSSVAYLKQTREAIRLAGRWGVSPSSWATLPGYIHRLPVPGQWPQARATVPSMPSESAESGVATNAREWQPTHVAREWRHRDVQVAASSRSLSSARRGGSSALSRNLPVQP